MSSKQAEEMGLTRKGDGYSAPPEHFTILDVDVSREKLIGLYVGKPTEIAIIEGVRQERRSKVLAPPEFVEACESGVTDPIQFVRLKPDANGRAWLIVDKGNNRCAALRVVNARRKVEGFPPFELPALQAPRPGQGEAAGRYARERHALSNVRAKMLPSHKAEVAAGFAADGVAPHNIVRYLDGVSTEAEVSELLSLSKCIDAVKDAVDAGEVPSKSAVKLAKMSEEKQAEWLAAKLAPKDRATRGDGPRPLSAKKIVALYDDTALPDAMREMLAVIAGKIAPRDVVDPDLRAALLRAGIGVVS